MKTLLLMCGISFSGKSTLAQTIVARLEEFMQTGRDIVLDDTNCFRWIRDRFRDAASRNGYRTVIVFLDIPLGMLEERRLKNELTGDRRAVDGAIFQELCARFEAPDPDETTLIFKPGDDAGDWICERFG